MKLDQTAIFYITIAIAALQGVIGVLQVVLHGATMKLRDDIKELIGKP